MPSTETEVVSMLKAVMFEAALIKVCPISALVGTDVDANVRFAVLMIDPLLQRNVKKNMVIFT